MERNVIASELGQEILQLDREISDLQNLYENCDAYYTALEYLSKIKTLSGRRAQKQLELKRMQSNEQLA